VQIKEKLPQSNIFDVIV